MKGDQVMKVIRRLKDNNIFLIILLSSFLFFIFQEDVIAQENSEIEKAKAASSINFKNDQKALKNDLILYMGAKTPPPSPSAGSWNLSS